MRTALLALSLLLTASGCHAETPQKPAPKIQEDDPQWDCKTMGDKHCGPAPKDRTSIPPKPRRTVDQA